MKTERTDESLLERRKLAEMATPGPWKNPGRCFVVSRAISEEPIVCDVHDNAKHNIPYLCANSPKEVMADIDEILRLRAQVERLEREADWLANQLGQDDNCPYIASGGDGFPDWCICIDSYEDGFYCDESMKECWRKAARKAVESSHEN